MNLKLIDCPVTMGCRTKVVKVGDEYYQRKAFVDKNGKGGYGLVPHVSCYTPAVSVNNDIIYHSKWKHKKFEERYRYSPPSRTLNDGIKRAPDVTQHEFKRIGNRDSNFVLCGIFVAEPDWKLLDEEKNGVGE